MGPTEAVARELCESGKFETGEGTCAAICMQSLGEPRRGPHGCPYRVKVFQELSVRIVDAVRSA